MNICCVEGCTVDREPGVSYFNFPTSQTLRRKWLEAINPSGKLSAHALMCSKHFSEDNIEVFRGKRRLKRKVVPSLLLNEKPSKLQKQAESSEESKSPPSNTVEIEIPLASNSDNNIEKHTSTEEINRNEEPDKTIDNVNKEKERSKSPEDKERNRTEEKKEGPRIKVDMVENGKSCDRVKAVSPDRLDDMKDIEDIITPYQIKQTFPLQRHEDLCVSEKVDDASATETIDVDSEPERSAVFIEISVDSGRETNDCLMVLESVQVEVDPSSLLPPERDESPAPLETVSIADDEEDDKNKDPISLLTSSDDDDVILQEPKIDTVEVSDETDEDDVPLVKLVATPKKKKTKKKTKEVISEKDKVLWGLYQYYCIQCHYRAPNMSEYKKHIAGHSVALHVCQICAYTTSSKTQYDKHKRSHTKKNDKRFICHYCSFRAKHTMSLIYHLKTHEKANLADAKGAFRCHKCNFSSHVKSSVLKHVKACRMKFRCDMCSYETKNVTDIKRHKLRKHDNEDEDDEYLPRAGLCTGKRYDWI